MGDKQAKVAKKLAKAAAKAAKKRRGQAGVAGERPAGEVRGADGLTPAERAAAAAEQQVRLQRWRVILAALSAAVGLATAAYMWLGR